MLADVFLRLRVRRGGAFERELDARLGSTWKAAPDALARLFAIEETKRYR